MKSFVNADAVRLPFADKVFSMTFTSPPYLCARTYGIDAQRKLGPWIEWMLEVVAECCRVTKGIVFVNCAGVTKDWCYQPGPEGLLYEWVNRGGIAWRPAYWHRNGIPGSGGKHWLKATIEYVLAFTDFRGPPPWADNLANGQPPKCPPGGEMSYRGVDGKRKNENGKPWRNNLGFTNGGGRGRDKTGQAKKHRRISCGHDKNGELKGADAYVPPAVANPGNLVRGIKVGGGLMGHPLAHENEAPFPLALAQWFIRGWCPPGGIVLDPFSGSGTTVHAALSLGRRGVGCDLRESQCRLGARRCADVQLEAF